jgi:arylsulfatase B
MRKGYYIPIVCVLAACGSSQTEEIAKPNIVIIVADDMGWNDVGFHGSDILTPHLDRLASESMELTRFYVTPICSPTRAGLLTGLYPDRFNLRNHVFSPRHIGGIPPDVIFLPEVLETAGYRERGAFGKWHLGHSDFRYHPNNRGFSYFYGHYNGAIDYFTLKRDAERDWHMNNEPSPDEGYSTDLIERDVVRFIREARRDSPFFAYVAFNAPHSPMQAKIEDLEMYGFDPEGVYESYPVGGVQRDEREMDIYGRQGRGNTLRQTYAAMVTAMDRSIGHILEAIYEKGIEENTIVWFFSDNGGTYRFGGDNRPLRGAKHSEWEGGIRTVSLVRWPGIIAEGSKSDEVIAYIDIFPTIEKLVTGKITYETDGIDVLPALQGKTLPDRYLFLGNQAIVSKKWKMNEGELFLIEEDMSEERNLAAAYPEVVEKLSEKIEKYNMMYPSTDPEVQPDDWCPPANWTMPVRQ